MGKNIIHRIFKFIKDIFIDAASSSLVLFKVMIPVSIIVKVLQELDVVVFMGKVFSPLMYVVGLPGEMGLVWATGIITNMFGGIMAYISISSQMDITVAQVTILATMLLVAHTFPVELQIARKCGLRVVPVMLIRFVFAIVMGFILYVIYDKANYLQGKAEIPLLKAATDQTLLQWAVEELKKYFIIFLLVCNLFFVIKVLQKVGVIGLLARMLTPLFRFLGISNNVMTITITGLLLGIVYGGALIIHEARSGKVGAKDVFYAMVLMSLCHSIIEDTLLMMSLGAHISGILVIRAILAILITFLIVRVMKKMEGKYWKYFLIKEKSKGPLNLNANN